VTDLAAELVNLITTDLARVDEPVTTDTDLLLSGLVDSLGVVRLVQWLEDRFGFEIDPADVTLDNFQTVAAMIRYVDRKQATAA
jgi:acyl carrier protein